MPALLNVEHIVVCYGRLAAVRDISFGVNEGEIVCIVGPNGAGKSTTLLAIAGALPLSAGRIDFDGREISRAKPETIARLGLSMAPEGRRIFARLTVEENLFVAAAARRDRASMTQDLSLVFDYFPRLAERRHAPAGRLSGGEQQMLAIGRALIARPRLIAVDEPSLGLAPILVDQVYDILLKLRQMEHLTLLIVEQSAERAMNVADRLYVLRTGRIAWSGARDEFADRARLEEVYFGVAAAS